MSYGVGGLDCMVEMYELAYVQRVEAEQIKYWYFVLHFLNLNMLKDRLQKIGGVGQEHLSSSG